MEGGHFAVTDLDTWRVDSGIDLAFDVEPSSGGSRGDKLHDDLIANQRLATPVLGDEREQPVLDLVPLCALLTWKTHLAADRTSCCRATANQMRLFLHIGAYWLMWSLRAAMPRRSIWRVAQFDTLRLRVIKLAARVEVLKRKVMLQLPRSTANQPLFACALARLSRMLT